MGYRCVVLATVLLSATLLVAPPLERKALVIGVDGLRPDQMMAAETPWLDSLMRSGATCLTARNAWTPEHNWNGHSATNWGVMLTGLSPATTDLTLNGDGDHSVDDDGNLPGTSHPSLFGRITKAREARTGVFNTWGGIGMGADTILQNCQSSVDVHHNPQGDGTSAERDIETVDHALAGIEGGLDVVFVHLSQCDAAGHAGTYTSHAYRQSIERIDALLGRILRAIESERDNWIVVLSTDHGGQSFGSGHADASDPEVHTIPFLLRAPGRIKPGSNLKEASLYDVVPTVLDWLGLQAGDNLDGVSRLQRARQVRQKAGVSGFQAS